LINHINEVGGGLERLYAFNVQIKDSVVVPRHMMKLVYRGISGTSFITVRHLDGGNILPKETQDA
jgi:hypothetical protein